MKKLLTVRGPVAASWNNNNNNNQTPEQGSGKSCSMAPTITGTPETPHIYLFSPSSSSSVSTPTQAESSDSLLQDREAEINSLRHKIQCMEAYQSDLIEELRTYQDENETLATRLNNLKKLECSERFIIQSPGNNNNNNNSTESDFDLKISDLSDELSKSRGKVSLLEDQNFELSHERDECLEKLEKHGKLLGELREEVKALQEECWVMESSSQKQVSELKEKDSIIESLQCHCSELKEILDQKQSSNKLPTPTVIKYFHPSHSFNVSDSSIAEEEPLDLGMEVIDLQLQDTKLELEKAKEELSSVQEALEAEKSSHSLTREELLSSQMFVKECEKLLEAENERFKALTVTSGESANKILVLEAANRDLDAEKKELNYAMKILMQELLIDKEELYEMKLKLADVGSGSDSSAAEKLSSNSTGEEIEVPRPHGENKTADEIKSSCELTPEPSLLESDEISYSDNYGKLDSGTEDDGSFMDALKAQLKSKSENEDAPKSDSGNKAECILLTEKSEPRHPDGESLEQDPGEDGKSDQDLEQSPMGDDKAEEIPEPETNEMSKPVVVVVGNTLVRSKTFVKPNKVPDSDPASSRPATETPNGKLLRSKTFIKSNESLTSVDTEQLDLEHIAENIDGFLSDLDNLDFTDKLSELNGELKQLQRENNHKLWDLQVAQSAIRNFEAVVLQLRTQLHQLQLEHNSRKTTKTDAETMTTELDPKRNSENMENLMRGKDEKIADLLMMNRKLEDTFKVKVDTAKKNSETDSREKYRERFETYKREVASIIKNESEKATKLKKYLGDAQEHVKQLELENTSLKREISQLKQNSRQAQLTINSMKDKEKHQQAPSLKPESSSPPRRPSNPQKRIVSSGCPSPTRSLPPASPTKSMSPPHRRATLLTTTTTTATTPRFEDDLFSRNAAQRMKLFRTDDKEPLDPNRKSELCRRNSMVLPHMKSCYPMEYIVFNELEPETLFKTPAGPRSGIAKKVPSPTDLTASHSAPGTPLARRNGSRMGVRFENRL